MLSELGKTKNNLSVLVDLEESHAATHLTDTPKLLEAVTTVLPSITLTKERENIEIDTRQTVGLSDLVATGPNDEIVYALRPHRDRYSRFVKNREAVPCSWIVMRFDKLEENSYLLFTAYAGRLTPSFPGGDYLPEQSKEFWAHHALVWGNQEVIEDSITTECPW